MSNRSILAARNTNVDKINEIALQHFSGEAKTYLSADSVDCKKQKSIYPTEFLNKISGSGLPPHNLILKKYKPVFLLRNIDQANGLCNGTRLIIREMYQNFLDVEISTGKNKNQRFFIPKLSIAPSDLDHPVHIKRIQFPIRSAFSMTINKAQGATLKKVKVFLNEPVFTHGQLYVALSMVASVDDLIVATNSEIKGSTWNVVYREVID